MHDIALGRIARRGMKLLWEGHDFSRAARVAVDSGFSRCGTLFAGGPV